MSEDIRTGCSTLIISLPPAIFFIENYFLSPMPLATAIRDTFYSSVFLTIELATLDRMTQGTHGIGMSYLLSTELHKLRWQTAFHRAKLFLFQ